MLFAVAIRKSAAIASVRLSPITRRLTFGGGTGMPLSSKLALSAAMMVAPLSTSVPSQSKMASLIGTASQFFDGCDDVVTADRPLPLDCRRKVVAALMLVELAGSAKSSGSTSKPTIAFVMASNLPGAILARVQGFSGE